MNSALAPSVVEAGQCPLCRRPNHCQLCSPAAYKGPCWCTTMNFPDELLARVPGELRNKACICEKCVTEFVAELAARPVGNSCRRDARRTLAGGDVGATSGFEARAGEFYFDLKGLMVFTEAYHLRRGFCCGNGCRHCPYPDPK